MNIIVLAAASRSGGALSIFRQFLKHLPNHIGDDRYYVFKDGNVETPQIEGVEYVVDNNHSITHRIYFDSLGIKKWCRKRKIKPDLVVSFQNSASSLGCPQLVYYHQSLPLYHERWNVLKPDERTPFFYSRIYPILVKCTLGKNTEVVVQTESLRRLFCDRYDFDYGKTHAFSPDVEKVDVDSVEEMQLEEGTFNFIYPAIAAKYKRHSTLADALANLKEEGWQGWEKIRIYLTFGENDYPEFAKSLKAHGLERQFVFLGSLPYSCLLSYYKAMHGLLFPSTIETIGLPLLEAAMFGLPVIATDSGYAQDVLAGYEGATHLDSFKPRLWAEAIKAACRDKQRYRPMSQAESTWPMFFNLIKKGR